MEEKNSIVLYAVFDFSILRSCVYSNCQNLPAQPIFGTVCFYFLKFDDSLNSNWFLQYAHRRCIQRWCNEKGDTTCEICHQVA
jgi:hypothetical protein